MIEIVILVCSISEPAKCENVRLGYMAQAVTPQQCMQYGQHEIAKWMESHPKWRIKRWRCGQPKMQAKA